jgi:hypothetical protein
MGMIGDEDERDKTVTPEAGTLFLHESYVAAMSYLAATSYLATMTRAMIGCHLSISL